MYKTNSVFRFGLDIFRVVMLPFLIISGFCACLALANIVPTSYLQFF